MKKEPASAFPVTVTEVMGYHSLTRHMVVQFAPTPDYRSKAGKVRRWRTMPEVSIPHVITGDSPRELNVHRYRKGKLPIVQGSEEHCRAVLSEFIRTSFRRPMKGPEAWKAELLAISQNMKPKDALL